MTVPAHLRYTTQHEWLDPTSQPLTVGVTAYAADAAVMDDPSLVNVDPYGAGWLLRIETDADFGVDPLLSAAEYGKLTAEQES